MTEIVDLRCDTDCILAQTCSRKFAEDAGFRRDVAWAIATAVSELCTNAIKFAGSARLILRRVDSPRPGIEVVVEDDGPGFTDARMALLDGYSENKMPDPDNPAPPGRRGIGLGLGIVGRLMDDLVVENRPDRGARVSARKWL